MFLNKVVLALVLSWPDLVTSVACSSEEPKKDAIMAEWSTFFTTAGCCCMYFWNGRIDCLFLVDWVFAVVETVFEFTSRLCEFTLFPASLLSAATGLALMTFILSLGIVSLDSPKLAELFASLCMRLVRSVKSLVGP